MKLLVTGGLGFIGMNFINYWLAKYDDEIINLDKQTYAANNPKFLENNNVDNYKFIKGSICERDLVFELLGDVDVVVNFAAETHVDNSIYDSTEFVRTNIEGTQILLEAVRKHDLRFHHISTDEVFGSLDYGSIERFTEDTCYKPKNPYSATKAAADHLVDSYVNTYGIKATISNCSNNFGPLQHTEKLIPKTIIRLLKKQKAQIYGTGNQIRDWIYVEDHCEAIDTILGKGKIGQNYLVSANNERTNLQVVREIIRILGLNEDKSIDFIQDRPGHDVRYALDSTKLQKELGWKPSHSFTNSLRETIDFYKLNETYFH